MKKAIKWTCLVSLLIGCLASCTENITSYSTIYNEKEGCTSELESFVNQQIIHFNLSNGANVSKETAIKNFDNFVNNLENEIEDRKYPIFKNTSIILSLHWYDSIIKETKLNLQQNTPNTVVITAEVTIEHLSGNSEAFIHEYGKKLNDIGLLTENNSYYLYYGEFATYNEANEHFNEMNKEGLLDVVKLQHYLRSLAGFDYTGKITINYLIFDGNEAPKGSAVISSGDNPEHTKILYDNYKSYNGWIHVNIQE